MTKNCYVLTNYYYENFRSPLTTLNQEAIYLCLIVELEDKFFFVEEENWCNEKYSYWLRLVGTDWI